MESYGITWGGGCVSKSRGEMGWVVEKERPNYYSTESEVTFSTQTWLKMSLFVFFICPIWKGIGVLPQQGKWIDQKCLVVARSSSIPRFLKSVTIWPKRQQSFGWNIVNTSKQHTPKLPSSLYHIRFRVERGRKNFLTDLEEITFFTSWWLNQPIWKNILVKWDHFPR